MPGKLLGRLVRVLQRDLHDLVPRDIGDPVPEQSGLEISQSIVPFILISLIPAIEEVLADALTAAELSDGVIASQAYENNVYLLFGGVFSSGLAADIANSCFSRYFLLHDETFRVDGKASLNSKLQFVSHVLTGTTTL